jgi:hypothetical protein
MVDQALMCLEMMDFDDKDIIMQKISQMGTMFQKLIQYMQIAFDFASRSDPMMAQRIAMDMMQVNGGQAPVNMAASPAKLAQVDNIGGVPEKEHAIVAKARQQSNDAAQPDSDGAVNTKR